MKKLDLSAIAVGAAMPLKKGSLQLIQDSYKEVVDALVNGLIQYTPNTLIVLYGCKLTNALGNTQGAMYYNGEIYLVDAASTVAVTGSNIRAWAIRTDNILSTDADGVVFSDGVSRNVHQNVKIKLVDSPIGGSGVAGYVADYGGTKNLNEDFLYDNLAGTITPTNLSISISNVFLQIKRTGKMVHISGSCLATMDASVISAVGLSFKITPTILPQPDSFRACGTCATVIGNVFKGGGSLTKSNGELFLLATVNFASASTAGDVHKVSFNGFYETT